MKKITRLALILFVLILSTPVFIFNGCKREIVSADNENGRKKALAALEERFKKEGAKITYTFEPGDIPVRKTIPNYGRTEIFCVADFNLVVTNYVLTWTSSCGSYSNYQATISFRLEQNNSYPPPTNTALIDAMTWITDATNGTTGPHTISLTYLGNPSAGVYEYKTQAINFSSYSINYCDVSNINLELIVPPDNCSGTPISVDLAADIDFSAFDLCKATNTVTIATIGTGHIYYAGWPFVCTPCNFFMPDKFEFQYRLQNTSTWTTATQIYCCNVYYLPLASGTYEWRYRNKMDSPSCYGPYSDIQTFYVP